MTASTGHVAAVLVFMSSGVVGVAQAPREVNPCVRAAGASDPSLPLTITVPGAGVRLIPRDEGPQRPDFVDFRQTLSMAAGRRDVAAVLAAVHPTARVAFDGSAGPDAFKKLHIDSPDEDFWSDFAAILSMGGRFRTPDEFDAPYVFAFWPEDLDPFECLAVTGAGVRLRERPTTQSRVLASLTYDIVQRAREDDPTPGWQRVRNADARAGFIASRYLRSPVDHRAMFSFQGGRWWLMAYLAGD
jgi:hypothetical protein